MDHTKIVIKAGKRYKADEKLRCLKLLNKAIMCADSNPQFWLYAQKKILKRLAILAQYCPKGHKLDDAVGLLTRGEHLFLADETDKKSAAHFLIVLLDCIEKWSIKYPINT